MTQLDPEYLDQIVNELEQEMAQLEANQIQDAEINEEVPAK